MERAECLLRTSITIHLRINLARVREDHTLAEMELNEARVDEF